LFCFFLSSFIGNTLFKTDRKIGKLSGEKFSAIVTRYFLIKKFIDQQIKGTLGITG